MKVIAIDNDLEVLASLRDMFARIPDADLVETFTRFEQALEFLAEGKVDIVLLSADFAGQDSLKVASRIAMIRPGIVMVFLVGAQQDPMGVITSRLADYCIPNPPSPSDLDAALVRARFLVSRMRKTVSIRTFGNFSVQVDGKPLIFTSPKAKEMLAVMVDQHGDTMSNETIFNCLYEDKVFTHEHASTFRKVCRRLDDILEKAGVPDLLVKMPGFRSLNTSMIECDYFDFLDGDLRTIYSFKGNYMKEYSWGEPTLAQLIYMKRKVMANVQRKSNSESLSRAR